MTAAAPTAANPVTVLQLMHVTVPPGVSTGQTDVYGDRYASGQFADGERVVVYTYATQTAMAAAVARLSTSSDANKLLTGNLFTVTVTGVDAGAGGISFPESLVTLSRETGAKVKG